MNNNDTLSPKLRLWLIGISAVILLGLAAATVISLRATPTASPSAASSSTETTTETTTNSPPSTTNTDASTESSVSTQVTQAVPPVEEDPQKPAQSGNAVSIPDTVTNGVKETDEITLGIDVSKYQGTIDWEQTAQAGIDFVMVRLGYRTAVSGEITADTNAKYNLQEAQKHGIKLGAYFFSTAVTREEAIEEAHWVADFIAQYKISYPVAYNCEGFTDPENRQYSLTKTQRTDLALTFLETIAQRGYTPMFYASKNELQADAQWETSRIAPLYKIWVAQYPALPYPQTSHSSYEGVHDMWQYTTNGTVPGISQGVDVNVAYFGYDGTGTAQNDAPAETVGADPEALMRFTECNETVTAKIETNLRSIPSQGSDSTVLYTLKNGETATRIGISDSGWSKVVFQGNTYYAVSSYLTTDLNYQVPIEPPQGGQEIKTPFTPVNDQVTAKEVVNLRSLPSVTDENSVIVAQLENGVFVTRTGINTDVGWSRVEYNGQTLYCISSYLTLQDAQEPSE